MEIWDRYCQDVKSGKISACLLILQAVERFEAFKKRKDVIFDEGVVKDCIDFFATMKHFLGKSANKPFILSPWQTFVIAAIFGLKWKKTGFRVCTEAYIQIARKAGKDAFMAGICLFLLTIEGEAAPEIVCAANSTDQARILFKYVSEFAKSIDPKENVISQYKNYVETKANNGIIKVISSDASRADGMNLSAFCLDEYHEARDRRMYDVLKSSQGMREQPLAIIITTAGFNLDGPCHDMYELAIEVLSGTKKMDNFWPFVYQLDPEDDWRDPKNFEKCQPNLGVTVTEEFMQGEVNKAKVDATALTGVLTKTFNRWVQAQVTWIPQEIIARNMDKIDIEEYRGRDCIIGCDLSTVSDFSSISVFWPPYDKTEKYAFKTWTFIPNETYKNHPNKVLYQKFVQEGSMIITDGNVTDYDFILHKIYEISQVCNIHAIYLDKWNATQFQISTTNAGYNVIEFSQAVGNYNACTKEFERLTRENQVRIDKSANILWQFGNVFLKGDINGNCLDIKTIVPTPYGDKTMEELEIGDYVYNADGKPTKIIDATPIINGKKCYKVTLQNGDEIIASENHRWWVNVGKDKYDFRTSEWIANHLKTKQGHNHLHVPLSKAVEKSQKEFLIDPYILGLWLGDGTSSSASFTVHKDDAEMYNYVKDIYGEPSIHSKEGENWEGLTFTGKTLYRQLVELNLLNNKHIPSQYFEGSKEQRLSLVQGLMDTDGSCNKKNQQCAFSQKRRDIVDGLAKLLDSLGIRHSKVIARKVKDKIYYHLNFYTDIPVFKLKRKLDVQKKYTPSRRYYNNPILSIEEIPSVPVKCIEVEDDRHLFLVGEHHTIIGNCKPSKESNNKKIDSVISMTTALGGWLKEGGNISDMEIFVF